ncbi:MFS transporter [Curvivirga sp.]|uniref:MFS transporter n=1 Tax=Curvivirga sp. TaxID=2856848 RepID=UPI003B5A0243
MKWYGLKEKITNKEFWHSPEGCLIILASAMPLAFTTWMTLLNNFTIEKAAFTGTEIGILQSLREVPGFLAFAAVFLLLFMRERTLAITSMLLLGGGVFITGFFPSAMGLYITTVIMSIGFHYYETMQMSLTLQWMSKDEAPKSMGRQTAARSFTSLIAYAMIWIVMEFMGLDYAWVYAAGGGLCIMLTLYVIFALPNHKPVEEQHKKMILRKRYWLFYALTFMGGARRQIFVVFAGFLMVEKFGYDVATITLLYLANHVISMWFAPKVGQWIAKWGERRALIVEYIGLILVFVGYGLTESAEIAAGLYVLDHLFFAFAIAQRSYFQKIADPKDIASTAGVSFSINHIAAIGIPFLFGYFLWSESPAFVFYAGAIMAVISLILALNVPHDPKEGNEVVIGHVKPTPVAAE